MTKAKINYEEKTQALKPEIVTITENGEIISIKIPILVHKSRYEIINKICELTGEDLTEYARQAMYEKVQSDLDNPQMIGQLFTERIRPIWETNKSHNDYRALQSDCGFAS